MNTRRGFLRLLSAAPLLHAANASQSAKPDSLGRWNVRDFGATGTATGKDTAAIQRAIDAASQAGGGMVVIPPGRYLSGTIYLKDGITLRVEKGATLLGTPSLTDYPERQSPVPADKIEFPRYALISAVGVNDVGLEGDGVIDGQGHSDAFNIGKNREKGMSAAESIRCRPFLLGFTSCRNVRVQGLTLRNSANWVQGYLDCDDVLIEGLTVRSRVNGNNDGIDIDGCRNVRVSNCDISSGDDALCLKATYKDCEGVTVTNCILSSGCNAFKCGTASIGGFRDITASNCVVYDTALSGIALEIVDGGTLDGVVATGFTMRNVGSPIFVRLGDRHRDWIKLTKPLPIGQVRNIVISDVTATGCGRNRNWEPVRNCAPIGSSITGLPGHPVQGVTLSNIRLTYLGGGAEQQALRKSADIPDVPAGYPEYDMFRDLPSYGLYCRHVEQLSLSNVAFDVESPDARPAVVCDDVKDLELEGLVDRAKRVTELASR